MLEEEDFLILQCPACEKDVKLPYDSVGQRMGCPYCMQPLEVAEGELDDDWEEELVEEEEPEREPKPPVERRPLVFRELRDDDVAEVSTLEYADEHTRRRLPFEAPEWDVAEDDGDSKEGVVLRDPSGKKLLTRREQNFRVITIIVMSSALLAAAIIAGAAIFHTLGVAGKDAEITKETNDEVKEGKAKVKAASEAITINLLSEEEKAALAVVNGFTNAKTTEERLKFVRDPERVEPLMREWYARQDSTEELPEGKAILRDKFQDQGRFFIRLAVEFPGIDRRIFLVEQQAKDQFKLDWETAVGYQPQSLADFKADKARKPADFRVTLRYSDYYNYHFADREKYHAVELAYPGREFSLIGYIDRSRPWAPELIEKMESGVWPGLIVRLKYPEGDIEDERQVEILSIVSPTWLL